MTRVLVVATGRKTRGGITSVIKAHEVGSQWKKNHCVWVQTHRDGTFIVKLWYLCTAIIRFLVLAPFCDIVHIHFSECSSAKRKSFFLSIAKNIGQKSYFTFSFLFARYDDKKSKSTFVRISV